jgi:hypothetical protein
MKKRIARFVLDVVKETYEVTVTVFLMIIPLLYMCVKLGESDNMFTEALATITASNLHGQSRAVLLDGEIFPVYLGVITGIVMLACLARMMRYVLNWRAATPNEEQLYDYIDRLRRKQRDAVCSMLLHEIDASPEKYQPDVKDSVK